MTSPLLDLAARPQTTPRCLVLTESDRARSGSSIAVLLRDPSTTSPHWPLALAAYRRIWSGYKAHAPVVSATALLTQVANTFASEPDLLERPDLVAAFLTVEGGELMAWALPTALVLVRQGEELGELGPYGFSAVPTAGSLARSGEESGLWHGRLDVEAGVAVCLIERVTGARLGSWRLRHALGAESAEHILSELGTGNEAAIAGRVVRIPELAAGRGRKIDFQLAPAAAAPVLTAQERQSEATGPLLRGARRHPEVSDWRPRQTSWLDEAARADEAARQDDAVRVEGERVDYGAPANYEAPIHYEFEAPVNYEAPVEDAARTAIPAPARESYPVEDLPAGNSADEAPALAAADPQSAAGTPFPLGTGFDESGFLLTGRRQRQQPEPGLRDPLLSWSSEVLDGLGQTGRASGRESDRLLLRRALVWASLGAASILVLAILILIGRLLMGPRPEGPEVSPGLELSAGSPAVESPEAGNGRAKTDSEAEPPPAFTGASWTRRFPQPISSSPLILDQQLFVGCRNGSLYALALADGKERWRLPVGAGVGSSPVAAGSLVVVGSYSGDVVAAEAETGRERWRNTTGGKIVSSPAFVPRADLVVIGSHDCHVYGLSADDGTMRWKTLTGGIIWASPILAKDRIMVGSHDGALYCLDAATGRIEWRSATGAPISSTAAVWKDRAVVVGSGDGKVHAFKLADGKPLWSQRAGSPVGGTLTVAGDLVLAGTDGGELLALAGEDGAIRYRVRTRGAVKSRPAVNQGQIWFTSYDGRLRVVDLASGKDLWSFPASGAIYSSPAVLGRTAFFGSMNGTLYAATWTGNPVAAKL